MHKYLTILRLGWLDAIEYRTDFFVSIFSWGIRLFIAIFLWLAVSQEKNGMIGSYNFANILGYFFIIQIIGSVIVSRVGFEIAYDIYRGDIVNHLLKPMHYLVFRLVHEISKNTLRTIMGVIIFGTLLFAYFEGIPLPAWKIPLGLITILNAYLINFFLLTIIALTAFWVHSATRFTFIYFGILTIFSGMIVPLDLFPQKFAEIFLRLPFAYIFYFPAKLIQAPVLTSALIHGFLFQIGYIILLGIFAFLFFHAGVKKFEAVGR